MCFTNCCISRVFDGFGKVEGHIKVSGSSDGVGVCGSQSAVACFDYEAFLVLDFQRNLHFKALYFGLSSSWVPT